MNTGRDAITGLVLAGGRGSRMGGVDKGLQEWNGVPLAQHALQRLQPQVARVMINANRHLDSYRRFGVPLCPDDTPGFAGPLAGFLAGLSHCETPCLVAVPCDAPFFPIDLVARLAAGLVAEHADIAVASSSRPGGPGMQPVFCLMRCGVQDDLRRFIGAGGHKVREWIGLHRHAEVGFDDESAFANVNTLEDLRRLPGHG